MSKLPMSLQQFNNLVESQITYESHAWHPAKRRTRAAIQEEIRQHVTRLGGRIEESQRVEVSEITRQRILNESAKKWQDAGMGPNAARIAATEQLSKLTPQDWIEIGEKLFR